MKNPILKISILIILGILILIQFFRIDKLVPVSDPSADFIVVINPPRSITSMLKSSCYDCHSYQTHYPWYSNISPVSWVLNSHIVEARKHLNFSVFASYTREKKNLIISGMKQAIEEKEMPLKSYALLHKEARLDEGMREAFIKWLSEGKNDIHMP